MKPFPRAALLLLLSAAASWAMVVRPAPDFGLAGMQKSASLRSFRGQAVVLVVTRSARDKQFRRELSMLKEMYSQFAAEKVIFVAAIENGPQDVQSDIPFAFAANPAQVAADYGLNGRFGIAVIGVDGNLDLITTRPILAARVRDAVFNNFEGQQAARKQPSF